MKKFYILLIFISALTSCSSDDASSSNEPNPNLLQRVDFYPGTAYEKRWLFNSDGLLEKITKADGTILQSFTYDNHNRVVTSIVISDATSYTSNFTYNANGFVTAINGETLNFNSATNIYTIGDVNSYFTKNTINNDKLLVHTETLWIDYDWDGTPMEITNSEAGVSYTNSNVVSYYPNESCNSFSYDDHVNPLRNASLAVFIANSASGNLLWNDISSISANNVLSHEYCSEDPESSVYHYTYNTNNLPQEQSEDSYYFTTLENTRVSARYYYQGDTLP